MSEEATAKVRVKGLGKEAGATEHRRGIRKASLLSRIWLTQDLRCPLHLCSGFPSPLRDSSPAKFEEESLGRLKLRAFSEKGARISLDPDR